MVERYWYGTVPGTVPFTNNTKFEKAKHVNNSVTIAKTKVGVKVPPIK